MAIINKYIFSILASIGIVILSTIPIPEVKPLEGVPLIDKWVHFVMYGGLTCALWLDYFKNKHRKISVSICLVSIIYPAFLGGLMEIIQENLTTYRSGDMLDFIADCVGVILGFIISILAFTILSRKHTK
ncbi:MAG: VanZ family protein [Bacteroidaceae bacterium]|nr:VanZ family protein [Bacteroidaceae bacterium]